MSCQRRLGWVGLVGYALAALVVGPQPMAAQNADSALVAAVNRLDPGRRLRIEAAGRPVTEASFLALDRGELLLGLPTDPDRVPLADIERIWNRERATKTGAIVGGVAGAVLGTAFGLFVAEVICNNEDCNANTAGAVSITGLVGAFGGFTVGATVGSFIPVWKIRFP